MWPSIAAAASSSATALDAVTLGGGDDAPVLVRLPQRPWGAVAQLPEAAVKPLLGEQQCKQLWSEVAAQVLWWAAIQRLLSLVT